ncbi:MAG TPA: expansin EXLX1 family cellulose-binding protein [Pseudobacteroides sp.]|uniref:expansin EXLX1 family cellulose-binding protein n=1 Tax=Pseudobacteroides sp. TaxID=1968840 RepID=UPI002F94A4BD
MKRKALLMIFVLLCNLITQYSTVEAEGAPGTVAGDVHYGYATYYGGGYEGGCAMLDPVSKDYFVTALNIFDYNTAQMSGAYLEVTGPLGKINVLVTDLLPEGQKGDLDLNIDAFPHVANPIDGKVPVSWRIIPLNTDGPVQYKYKEGSSQYWMGVQVRNHRYPINKLEYMDQSGKFIELPRKNYNYFESTQMGPGPYTFRVTDIYGQEIIDKNIPFTGSETTVSGTNQFPIRNNTTTVTPTPTPSPTPSIVNKFFISGAIKPDVDVKNDALNKGFTVRISGTQFSANTDSNGNFKIDGIPEGTNSELIITKPSFLTRDLSLGRINSNITVKSPIDMWVGDVEVNNIQDGAINMLDVIEVAKAYNETQNDQNYSQKVDLNQDGKINIADVILIAKHFGKTSKDYGI